MGARTPRSGRYGFASAVVALIGAAILAVSWGSVVPASWALSFSFPWPSRPPPAPTVEQTSRVGCLLGGSPVVDRLSAAILRYCGPINDAGVALVQSMLDERVRTLSITSLGGSLEAPLDLADLIRASRLDVLVDGPCLSGCASIVFVAGNRREVAEGALLGVHNTASSATFLAIAALGGLAPTDQPLLIRAAREHDIYQRSDVDTELLFEPQARIEPVCVFPGVPSDESGETTYQMVSRYSLWFPSRRQWQAYGVFFSGYAPDSRRAVDEAMATTFPEGGRNASYVFGQGETGQMWWHTLLSTPRCG